MKQAHRFSGPGRPFHGLTKQTNAGPQWTGVVRTLPELLLEPLTWRQPARVFVNSMSDLFHDDVPDEFIDRVFAVMSLASRHTFQILTKRAERMHRYMTARNHLGSLRDAAINGSIWSLLGTRRGSKIHHGGNWRCKWPLPNVWLGVSTEDQRRADERIPLLLQTPAAVRFISAEPLIGQIKLKTRWRKSPACSFCDDAGNYIGTENLCPCGRQSVGLDWVIVGGESGHGARPCHIEWITSIVGQCQAAGTSVFVKQLGADLRRTGFCRDCADEDGTCPHDGIACEGLKDPKGGDPAEWPERLRVREFPITK